MRFLLTILIIVTTFKTFSQESSEKNRTERNRRESYFGAHADMVYSTLKGIEGYVSISGLNSINQASG